MALILTEELADGRVLTYHRVAEFVFTSAPPIVRFTLESFPSEEDRADPTVQPYRREYDFPFLTTGDPRTEAYRALLASPEWADAEADEPDITPGDFEARPAGQAVWNSDAGNWAGEDVDSAANKVWDLLKLFFMNCCSADIWWDGRLWFADNATQLRLVQACAVAGRLPDPSTYSRQWFGEDWSGPHTLTGADLIAMQTAIEQRQAEAEAHLGDKKQEILDAMEIEPASAAIAAIKAIQWEFDAAFWGMPP